MTGDSEVDAGLPSMSPRRGPPTVPNEDPPGGNSESADLLHAIVGLLGRAVFPEQKLRTLVSPSGNPAYFAAYAMCDGRTPLASIVKETGIDSSNLSKAVAKWVEAGVMFRVGSKRLPLNLYPVATPPAKATPKRGHMEKTVPAESTSVDLFSTEPLDQTS